MPTRRPQMPARFTTPPVVCTGGDPVRASDGEAPALGGDSSPSTDVPTRERDETEPNKQTRGRLGGHGKRTSPGWRGEMQREISQRRESAGRARRYAQLRRQAEGRGQVSDRGKTGRGSGRHAEIRRNVEVWQAYWAPRRNGRELQQRIGQLEQQGERMRSTIRGHGRRRGHLP